MITVWDCDYCDRVNPDDRFSCFGCGSPRLKHHEYNVSEVEYHNDPKFDSPYFATGGVSIRDKDSIYAVWL